MKVLFSTVYQGKNDYYDYFGSNSKNPFRFGIKRRISSGLRFLKRNIPFIEILEYPTLEEYMKKIKKGWDIVGFSFFIDDIPRILEMVDIARKYQIKEIWAGNYGALTEGINKYFDKIFIGYAESAVGNTLGIKVERIRHPVLPVFLELGPINIRYKPFGVLYTTRGCPMGCSFCQTPFFCPHPHAIPLSSIEEVLEKYKRMGIKEVVILDENFGIIKKQAEGVVELLKKYGFLWSVMTRADFFLQNIEEWDKANLVSIGIGIENLSPLILEKIKKKEPVEIIEECIRKAHERNIAVLGYYIIGFPEEKTQTVLQGIHKLATFNVDYMQVTILTPLPRTPLWYEIDEKYGIFEKDLSKFDTKHLVWKHPYISPSDARKLLFYGFKLLNSPFNYLKSIKRLSSRYLSIKKRKIEGVKYLTIEPLISSFKASKAKG